MSQCRNRKPDPTRPASAARDDALIVLGLGRTALTAGLGGALAGVLFDDALIGLSVATGILFLALVIEIVRLVKSRLAS